MSKKPQDLSWQNAYIAEYKRTSGLAMSFGPAEPGGWYTATIQSCTSETDYTRRFRRGEVVANTAVLMTRPDHVSKTPMPEERYFADYEKEPIGGVNPYYRCAHCLRSDPAINGRLEGHASDCQYRQAKETGQPYPPFEA